MIPGRFFLVIIYCLFYPGIVLKSQQANVSGKWEILDSGFVFNECRSILKISVSANGHLWRDVCTLENHKEGEYSYPAVIRGTDGTIYISYTVLRKKIKYVRLKFKSL
ncbi:MAG TPA: exo-alpha-sialidase [Chitinophagaceae bacterium]|nr:exo-alpha-sialidase [Chitinophagaceae bacterium]